MIENFRSERSPGGSHQIAFDFNGRKYVGVVQFNELYQSWFLSHLNHQVKSARRGTTVWARVQDGPNRKKIAAVVLHVFNQEQLSLAYHERGLQDRTRPVGEVSNYRDTNGESL